MNTRVQVEHCVTEMVTGFDIVREQIRIAAGEQLSIRPGGRRAPRPRDRVPDQRRGRPQELRPAPRAGSRTYREPAGPGVRVDSGVEAGSEITPMYDPMFAKLIVWDLDREKATARMLRALGEYEIGGHHDADPVPPGAAGHQAVGQRRDLPRPDRGPEVAQVARAGEGAGPRRATRTIADGKAERELSGRGGRKALRRQGDRGGRPGAPRRRGAGLRKPPRRGARREAGAAAASGDDLVSPLQGNVFKVPVKEGQEVAEGDAHLRDRGDEDGERDHRPQVGQDHAAGGEGGRRRQRRRPAGEDRINGSRLARSRDLFRAELRGGVAEVPDLASGALRPSSFSPCRLTQITGTFILIAARRQPRSREAMWTQPFLPPIRRAHSLKWAGSGL